MRISRTARVIAAAAVATAVIAAPAAARSTSALVTTGASFSNIYFAFDPWPCNSKCVQGKWSAMDYSGLLKDTSSDGHQVFVHAKVDGYGYATRVYTGSSTTLGQSVYGADPAQSGKIQTCRDRGTLLPDNCAASPTLYR